jgi:hypothetical protein
MTEEERDPALSAWMDRWIDGNDPAPRELARQGVLAGRREDEPRTRRVP